MSAIIQTELDTGLVYMSVKQVANYLHLNEKTRLGGKPGGF